MNRDKFFLAVRMDPVLFGGNMAQSAVQNINLFIDEFLRRADMLLTAFAAVLATARLEVGANMNPVREGFKKTDAEAQAYVKRNFPHYSKVYNGLMYYGRGYVQLTWLSNYQKFRAEILAKFGVDIVTSPDMVLRPDIAIYIIFEGMIRGIFTGKKLANYFTATVTNWIFRPIVNGMDKASLHANVAQRFHAAAKAAQDNTMAAPKAVVDNVTSRERNTVKVGTGAGGATAITEVAQGFGWVSYGIIAVCIAVVCLGAYLAYRKRTKLQEEWAKL